MMTVAKLQLTSVQMPAARPRTLLGRSSLMPAQGMGPQPREKEAMKMTTATIAMKSKCELGAQMWWVVATVVAAVASSPELSILQMSS